MGQIGSTISGKTGFTGTAGYCYVGALERDNKKLVVALLACGWPNNRNYKWKDTTKLMNYGLDNYEYSTFENAASDIPKSGRIQVLGGQTQKIGETAYVEWKVQDEVFLLYLLPGPSGGAVSYRDVHMKKEGLAPSFFSICG